jgi:HNH endonuclease
MQSTLHVYEVRPRHGIFRENKMEAKQRANFSCVICKEAFVEVHHIIPQSEGGKDTIDNAAPLCASCHDRYGGNPEKRKQIREMRDWWWEVCATRNSNPNLLELNEKLDAIHTQLQNNHASYRKALESAKDAFLKYHGRSEHDIEASTDFNSLSEATGIRFAIGPVDCPECGGRMSLSREDKGPGGNFVCWYRCDRCSHELPGMYGYKVG